VKEKRSLPLNLFEDRTKTFPFGRVDHLHKSYAPVKVRLKAGMSVAVLAVGTLPNTIGECCFEEVEIEAHYIYVLVDDEPR